MLITLSLDELLGEYSVDTCSCFFYSLYHISQMSELHSALSMLVM